MGKHTKLIFIAAAVLLLLGSFTLLKRDKNKVKFQLAENEVVIDNFEMGKVLDEQNNFYRVTAKKAKINRDKETALLTDFEAHYKKDNIAVDIYAPEGYLEREFIVSVKGNIKGRINDLSFTSGETGRFHFDFLIGLGTFLNGVTLEHGKGSITADKILVYSKNNYAEFIGNVKVTYNK